MGISVSIRRLGPVLAVLMLACALAPSARAAPLIAAAGDVACPPGHSAYNSGIGTAGKCAQGRTANLLYGQGYDAVLPLGDLIEPRTVLQNFRGVWADTWGRMRGITHPAIGNHEYDNGPARGYFDYFNGAGGRTGRAGTRGRGWYSYNLGRWHLIALNSVCYKVGCGPGSSQLAWLQHDLARHRNRCVLAYWHHPRFSSGYHGGEQPVGWFWRVLDRAGADVVINGHDHVYERFAPKGPSGHRNYRGIVQFTVGTGGRSLFGFKGRKRGSRKRVAGRFGVLRLRLGGGGYGWAFVALGGPSDHGGLSTGRVQVLDRGSRRCTK